jgi:hypothetical protein
MDKKIGGQGIETGVREIKSRVREVKRGKKWLYSAILVLLFGGLAAGYPLVYKPRVAAKNYASFAAITVSGVEAKLQAFDAAGPETRDNIVESFERLRTDFYAIECPDGARPEEIQWKMAKLFEYAGAYMSRTLQLDSQNVVSRTMGESGGKYTDAGRTDAIREARERIADLKWLINDTIAYGNFGRLK